MAYLLDANVFIQARNLQYGFDFCPAFWDWLDVRHAAAHGHVLVTHEQPSNEVSRIKIPNACVAMGVQFLNPYQMLRRERARFVLGR